MGNYLACVSSGVQIRRVQVFHADSGLLYDLEGTANVADLMIEYADQFVCHAKAFQTGQRRFSPLPADEELRIGELYILLPMRKLHARLSIEDIAFLSSATAISSSKRNRSKESQSEFHALPSSSTNSPSNLPVKVAGAFSMVQNTVSNSSSAPSIDSFLGPALSAAGVQQLMTCRAQSWVPKLETIAEVGC